MKTTIELLGVELELLQPVHGFLRYSSRINPDQKQDDCLRTVERILCEETTAEISTLGTPQAFGMLRKQLSSA